jgi:hypothetical protein
VTSPLTSLTGAIRKKENTKKAAEITVATVEIAEVAIEETTEAVVAEEITEDKY